ncbi:MAG: ABC transporter permease [Candidatus Anaerobiospirillum pullicola]|uniref:ABC transporter permease n=1 Tax=Candidatus Anaerobiospirillum pullicola TaxID=2838451 RepID=A0A948WYB9_9GAMM|nr:ABC transporter permease [Candidatus Anaerobiospirillum pullicola]
MTSSSARTTPCTAPAAVTAAPQSSAASATGCRCQHQQKHAASATAVPTRACNVVAVLLSVLSLRALLPLLRNTLGALLFLLVLSAASFVLVSFSSGDAALNSLQPMGVTSQEVINRLRQSLNLDLPVLEQYIMWLEGVVTQIDLGQSTHYGRAVTTVLGEGLTVSLQLCVLACGWLLLISLPLGIYSALHPRSLLERGLHMLSILLLSVPSFIICLVCLYFAGVKMGLITTRSAQSYGDYIAPALCLALPLSAYYIRQISTALRHELQAPYLLAFTARGIRTRTILLTHVLPRAMIALLPLLAISVGHLLCGTVIVETIFSLQGLGAMALQAITYRDLYLIQAYVLYSAAIFMALNALVNVLTSKLSRHALAEVATC